MYFCRINIHNSSRIPLTFSRIMSVFTQKLNPITGRSDWELQNEDYDFHQEVARSSYADMLHDEERNKKYEAALKQAIDKIHKSGRAANVLDIGTGTGLLSMMAVRNGADTVTACEAFEPIAKCAERIIEANGCGGRIKVVPKRSTELTVGSGCDLEFKANILVTEVFDTELIGEGALKTFSHAREVLLEEDCVVIPQSALVYVQVVECPLVQNWNKLKDVYNSDGDVVVKVPDSIKVCSGAAAVHDIQLSQIPLNLVNDIVSPTPALLFDFSNESKIYFQRYSIAPLEADGSGKAQVVFLWWELIMDVNREITLSCAPYWAHPQYLKTRNKNIPWRDHWMQAIYYLPKEVNVKTGQKMHLISCHDEFSFWFNLETNFRTEGYDYESPICGCGLHVSCSRTRIGQMNDSKRNKKLLEVLEENVNKESVVLILSHSCFLGLSAVKFGAKKVFVLEEKILIRRILLDFIEYNKFDNVVVVESVEELGKMDELREVNLVFAEPFYTSSILPWDNFLFSHILEEVRPLLPENVQIFPQKGVVYALPVQFKDLHKIRTPLGNCEGFDMTQFDQLIEKSRAISDSNVEAQPLWEYPATAQSEPIHIAEIDFLNKSKNISSNGTSKATCNGIALWVDWIFGASRVISTGPVRKVEVGSFVDWDMYTRQGVVLFDKPKVDVSFNYSFNYEYQEGNITFSIS